MSGVRQGSHLEHLLQLRERVDEEIAKERVRSAAADKRRAALAREQQEAAERITLEHLAEVERIEADAPADLVRAWARESGIAVGVRGRLSLDLRKQYIAATSRERQ